MELCFRVINGRDAKDASFDPKLHLNLPTKQEKDPRSLKVGYFKSYWEGDRPVKK